MARRHPANGYLDDRPEAHADPLTHLFDLGIGVQPLILALLMLRFEAFGERVDEAGHRYGQKARPDPNQDGREKARPAPDFLEGTLLGHCRLWQFKCRGVLGIKTLHRFEHQVDERRPIVNLHPFAGGVNGPEVNTLVSQVVDALRDRL